MADLLTVPYLGTAEKDVLVADWLVQEGRSFRKGDPLLVLETLKASFEVEAEEDGILLRCLVAKGGRVPIRAALGVWGRDGEKVEDGTIDKLVKAHKGAFAEEGAAVNEGAERAGNEKNAEGSSTKTSSRKAAGTSSKSVVSKRGSTRSKSARQGQAVVKAAPAARQKASELGIDLEEIPGTGPGGLVRVEDVEAAARGGAASRIDDKGEGGVRALGPRPHATVEGREVGTVEGTLDPEFVAFLEQEGEEFGELSSEFKLALYHKHGAHIGKDVRLGRGSFLCAQRLVLGDRVAFGDDCRVHADELVAGELVQFGPRCRVRCRRLTFGDNVFFAPDVEIGGGGWRDPEAELVVGSHVFVGEHVHLNICRRVVIGDEVVISRSAVLMTHSFGGNLLRGYPSRFAGVEIEDYCQIGIGAVLFPGVTMGEGSILLSGSSLVTSVPAGRLYGGVPAKDLKSAARDLDDAERLTLAVELVEEFARQLTLRGFTVSVTSKGVTSKGVISKGGTSKGGESEGETRTVLVEHEGKRHRLVFAPAVPLENLPLAEEDVRVGLTVQEKAWKKLPSELVAIDLSVPRVRGAAGPLTEAFREFLRKRGIRLHPRTWTYPGGWL